MSKPTHACTLHCRIAMVLNCERSRSGAGASNAGMSTQDSTRDVQWSGALKRPNCICKYRPMFVSTQLESNMVTVKCVSAFQSSWQSPNYRDTDVNRRDLDLCCHMHSWNKVKQTIKGICRYWPRPGMYVERWPWKDACIHNSITFLPQWDGTWGTRSITHRKFTVCVLSGHMQRYKVKTNTQAHLHEGMWWTSRQDMTHRLSTLHLLFSVSLQVVTSQHHTCVDVY